MTHAESKIRSASPGCAATAKSSNQVQRTLPGKKWRAALRAVAAAPVRLHRYRNFHTEVIEDAIRAYDCRRCT